MAVYALIFVNIIVYAIVGAIVRRKISLAVVGIFPARIVYAKKIDRVLRA